MKQLKAGETVWVGNDVLQQMDRKRGLMDAKLFRRAELLDVDFVMDKKDRLESKQAMVSHAMTLTGFDLADGEPTRWKIENSWGEDAGRKGYFVASDAWFDQFVYQAVVNRRFLTEDQRKALDGEPIELAPWDPMGSLA